MAAWPPAKDENPPSPPFDNKGGLGGFESYFLHYVKLLRASAFHFFFCLLTADC
jgi:hypothetical protein